MLKRNSFAKRAPGQKTKISRALHEITATTPCGAYRHSTKARLQNNTFLRRRFRVSIQVYQSVSQKANPIVPCPYYLKVGSWVCYMGYAVRSLRRTLHQGACSQFPYRTRPVARVPRTPRTKNLQAVYLAQRIFAKNTTNQLRQTQRREINRKELNRIVGSLARLTPSHGKNRPPK